MKTKMMKRAAAFAASVLMTAAFALPASAADQVKTKMSGVEKAFCGVEKIDIPKKIYLFNPDKAAVYAPNIIYTYTLGEGTGGDKITGLTWNGTSAVEPLTTVTVKAGIENAIKISGNTSVSGKQAQLEFGATDATFPTEKSATKGATNFEVQNLKIEKGSANFTGAGVYRYVLTESVNRTKTGVEDGTGDDAAVETRYLDVYVDAEGKIYGYVLANTENGYEYDAEADEASKKINELDPDFYSTFNVKIIKNITGSMADINHEFPVDITLNGANTVAEIYGTGDGAPFGNPGGGVNEVTLGNYGTNTYNLKNSEFVEIFGIPKDTTVVVDEKNDTNDSYFVTLQQTTPVKTANISGLEVKADTKLSATTGGEAVNREFSLSEEQQEYIIELTNNLDMVSPTGVLFRIAPYALMMTAGGVLIAVYLRGKKREDAESMI